MQMFSKELAAWIGFNIIGDSKPYVKQPGAGVKRAAERLRKQARIWAQTPPPRGISRQVGRAIMRRRVKDIRSQEKAEAARMKRNRVVPKAKRDGKGAA
ncbi:MAG: hypothetical protein AAGE80_05435 [Pseudomonadota bacterium]